MKKLTFDEIIERATREVIMEMVGSWEPKLNDMAMKAANWKTQTLPIVYGLDYVPESRGQATKEQEQVRKFIYVLKNDNQQYPYNLYQRVRRRAITIISDTILGAFGDKVANITLVPIPTHDEYSNTRRWKDLMLAICSQSGAENGYGYYYYNGNNTIPSHFNKGNLSGQPQGKWDRQFFPQKNVVLLDDLLTTGNTMERTKEELEKLGANVVMGVVVAKTRPK